MLHSTPVMLRRKVNIRVVQNNSMNYSESVSLVSAYNNFVVLCIFTNTSSTKVTVFLCGSWWEPLYKLPSAVTCLGSHYPTVTTWDHVSSGFRWQYLRCLHGNLQL